MRIEVVGNSFVEAAAQIGDLLDIAPADVPVLMRAGAITSLCERGLDADQGTFRLNFYYQTRRARLRIDEAGHVLQRSVIDYGKHTQPGRPGNPALSGSRPTPDHCGNERMGANPEESGMLPDAGRRQHCHERVLKTES